MAGLNDTDMGHVLSEEGVISWEEATQMYKNMSKGRLFDIALLTIQKHYGYSTKAGALEHLDSWNKRIIKLKKEQGGGYIRRY